MNFCAALRTLGKTVCLINCAPMPRKPQLNCYKGFAASFIDAYGAQNRLIGLDTGELRNNPRQDGNWLQYQGESYPFFQTLNAYAADEVATVVTILANAKPGAVIAVGDHNPLAELAGTFLPTVTYPCGAFLPSTVFSLPAVPRRVEDQDRDLAQALSGRTGAIIESAYTFRVRESAGKADRAELGVGTEAPLFVTVGNRLEEEIGAEFHALMRTMKSAFAGAKFLFVGPFADRSIIPEDLRADVLTPGRRDDVQALLRAADFYLNPRREGGGLSCAEAVANGRPVLTLRHGDVFHAAGPHFGFDDAQAMVDYVRQYRADPAFAAAETAYCAERTRVITDNIRMVRQLLADLDDLVGAAPASRSPTAAQRWQIEEDADVIFIRSAHAGEPAPADWRRLLAEALAQIPAAGVVGAKRLGDDGKVFSMGEMLIHPKGFHHHGRGVTAQAYRFPEEVDVLAGGVCALRSADFEAIEDAELALVDLCLNLRLKGRRCVALPQVVVTDTHCPEPSADEAVQFQRRWGFDWRMPDLEQIKQRHPASGLLWQVRFHSGALPFEKYEERPALHWQSYANVAVYRQRADHLVKVVTDACAPNALVLDLGCGDGLFSHLMAQQGLRVLGVDPETAAIEQARKRSAAESYPVLAPEFVSGRGDRLDIPDQCLDGVAMFDVIEHLPNPIAVLREIARVLRPGGRFIVSTPAWQFGGSSDPIYHGFEYTARELMDQVDYAGFAVINSGTLGAPYRDVVLVAQRRGE